MTARGVPAASPFEPFAAALCALERDDAAAILATLETMTIGRTTIEGLRQAYANAREWADEKGVSNKISELRSAGERRLRKSERVASVLDTLADRTASVASRVTVPEALTKELAEQIEARAEANTSRTTEELRRDIIRALSTHCRVTVPSGAAEPGPRWYRAILVRIGTSYKVQDVAALDDQLLADEVLRAVVQEALDAARKALQSAPRDEQEWLRERLTNDLYERLLKADARTQAEFAALFGTDEVTRDLLSRLLRDGSLLGGAWLAANAAGFALYVAATTIVHAVFTTLLGITLSFGTYMALTSFMAVIFNPFTALVGALGLIGGGYALLKRRLGPRVAAFAVVQILGASPGATSTSLGEEG